MRVLVVEDNDIKARCLKRALQHALGRSEVQVQETRTLDSALELLKMAPWDLVLSDWNFPRALGDIAGPAGRDMVDACEAAGIPVVVVSGDEAPPGFAGEWIGPDWGSAIVEYLSERFVGRRAV